MDPIDLLKLCRRGALEGAPSDIIVPRVFGLGDFEDAWRRDPVQVRRALDETLCAPHPQCGLELLLRSGAIHALFPEIAAIKDLGDDPGASLHKDVWEHTKQVVANVPNQLELRWGALVHDIGKARTRRFDGHRVTFHNHDVVGARMFSRLDQRLNLFQGDESLAGAIHTLVLNHLRPAGYKRSWTDSGVRRLLADLGGMQGFERLMCLSRADLTTKNPKKRDSALARGRELEERVRAVFAADNAPRLPKGTMGAVLSKVAAKPGPWLNAVREELEAMMLAGVLDSGRDVEYYVEAGIRLVEQHVTG